LVDKKGILTAVVLFLIVLSFPVYSQVYQSPCPLVAYEGELVQLAPAAIDPDPEIGPAGMLLWSFGPPFNATGEWQTYKGDNGIYDFWVSVSDGELKDTKYGCVDLLPNNHPPILYPVPEVYITRGERTKVYATCVDPDGDPVEFAYKFQGRDVEYIQYEPPGVYELEVICSDGYGGVAYQKTKLHVLMPEEIVVPKPPKQVFIPPVVEVQKPGVIEVVLPKNDTVEVVQPCACQPEDNIELVIYDGFKPVEPLEQPINTTRTFVIESEKMMPKKVEPTQEQPAQEPADYMERNAEIDSLYSCSCN
jgi:hypothetical protein